MSTSSSSPSMAGSDTTNSSSPTTSTTSSTPSSYKDSPTPPWIIYHLVERTIPCELPLRIMFSFNTGQKLPELRTVQRYWDSNTQGRLISEFFSSLNKITPSVDDTTIAKLRNPTEGPADPKASTDNAPGDRFMDVGNEALLDIDFTSLGVPIKAQKRIPALQVLNFVRKAFPEKYENVQFEHGLTALDYLRDLEFTRREKLRKAAERLNITLDTWKSVLAHHPDAFKWIELVQKYELLIEEGYANIFIDLRIWKMVAELKSTPFYKPHVLAMLNTLFPPVVKELPNDRIQPKILHQYRSSFYRYITAVEANGSSVMDAFEQKLQMDGNRHSWRNTWDNLMHYMELADQMIKQAQVAIDLGIDMFVGGNYTYRSPLGLLDREPLNFSTDSLARLTQEATFDSSFEGPSTRPRTTMRSLSFSKMSFRSHSRSRANTNTTTSTERPLPPQKESFESVSTTSILANTPSMTPTSSTDATPSTSFSSIASNARRSIYAANNIPMSAQNAIPPLPKLDTEAIRNRQRAVSKPVMRFINPDSPAAQNEAFSSTIILKDKRKTLRRQRSEGSIDLIDRPSTSAGEKKTTKVDGKDGKNPPKAKGEKALKEKKSIFDLRRPSTSHGEKTPKAKDKDTKSQPKAKTEKTLKEKKSMFDLRRPSSSKGEKAGEWKQPFTQKLIGPELRPSTSHGEKAFGVRQPKKGDAPYPYSAKSMRSPVPFGEELRESYLPEQGPLPARPNRASTFPTQRPTTSHGERRSQPVDLGTTIVRDFAPADIRYGKSSLVGSPTTVQFENAIRERSATTYEKHKRLPRPKPAEVANTEAEQPTNAEAEQVLSGKKKHLSQWLEKQEKEIPAPLGEFKRERTASFYYSHMDSPSMPPPLSLGPKKLDSRPEVPEKPMPSPAVSVSSRKPVPSSIPMPSASVLDTELSDKPTSSSLGRRMFLRKPVPSSIPSPSGAPDSTSPLPSDGLAFLSKPYEEVLEIKKSVRKRPSLGSLFLRKSEPAKDEEALPEPNTPKKPVSILKASKSMESLPKVEVGDPQPTPVLKSKRSIGETLRAKFNMKITESSDTGEYSYQPPKNKDKKSKSKPRETEYHYVDPKYIFNDDLSDAARVQRGELEVVIDGWKPSYMTKDQSVPRTPRGLKSPHFENEPEYTPGTVALPRREIVPLLQRTGSGLVDDNLKLVAQGGKYGQGQYVHGGDWFPKPDGSLAPQLKKQVYIEVEDEKSTAKERYMEKMVSKQENEKDETVDMIPVAKTTTEERLGPMIQEIKMIVAADEKPAFIVFEGNGEEDQPSPTDRGDETSYFEDNEPPSPSRLRGSKSTGDLRNGSRKKLVKKKSVDEVRGGSGIKTADISSPRPVVSLPEWDENLEAGLSKEYTRKHLLEKARAERGQYYLNPPSGNSVDRKLPKRKIRAMSKFQKLEAVKEEGSSPTRRGVLNLSSQVNDDGDGSDDTIVPEEKPKPIVKRVRILSQATREYGREFEQPRATPKPPKVPDGRKMGEEALLWTAEERERFREREMQRQKRGTLRMLFRPNIDENEEDWG